MQQVPMQSYANRTQENFSSLSEDEKSAIIRQHYCDMKARRIFSADKQHDIFFLFDVRTKLG